MKILKVALSILMLAVFVKGYSIPEYAQPQYQRQQSGLQNKFGGQEDQQNEENLSAKINELYNNLEDLVQENDESQVDLEEKEQDKVVEETPEGFQEFNTENNYFGSAEKESTEDNQQTFKDYAQENYLKKTKKVNPVTENSAQNLEESYQDFKKETIKQNEEKEDQNVQEFGQNTEDFNEETNIAQANEDSQEADKTTQDNQQTLHDFNHLQENQESSDQLLENQESSDNVQENEENTNKFEENQEDFSKVQESEQNFNTVQENQDDFSKVQQNQENEENNINVEENQENSIKTNDVKDANKKGCKYNKQKSVKTNEDSSSSVAKEEIYNKAEKKIFKDMKNWFKKRYEDAKKASKKVAAASKHAWGKTKDFFTPKAKEESHEYEYHNYKH